MEELAKYEVRKAKRLDDKEKRLLEFIRQLKYGEITIKIQDGLPVLIEKATPIFLGGGGSEI